MTDAVQSQSSEPLDPITIEVLRHGVVAVSHALGHLRDAVSLLVGNRQTSGVIARRIDAIAGCELLNGRAHELIGGVQILLSDQGVYVGLNREYFEILSVFCSSILPDTFLIDRHGRIAATYSGLVDKDNVEANLRAMLLQP